MDDFREEAAIERAREAAAAALYDVQKLREDSIERQAMHNLLTAVESLIEFLDHTR